MNRKSNNMIKVIKINNVDDKIIKNKSDKINLKCLFFLIFATHNKCKKEKKGKSLQLPNWIAYNNRN